MRLIRLSEISYLDADTGDAIEMVDVCRAFSEARIVGVFDESGGDASQLIYMDCMAYVLLLDEPQAHA